MQNVIIENRKKVVLSGVTDVDGFDDRSVLVYTQSGELMIRGKNLRVGELSVTGGDMEIHGDISGVSYGDKDKRRALSFLGKIFR